MLSTFSRDLPERLRAVPWSALEGHLPEVLAALEEVLSGAPAERALDHLLRRSRPSAEGRSALAEAVFGVALWRRRLAWQAGVTNESPDARALLFSLLRDLGGVETSEAAALVQWPSTAPLPPVREAPTDPALRHSLPSWLWDRLAADLGPDAEPFASSLNVPGPICFRANTLRITREALRRRLATEGVTTRDTSLSPHGLVCESPRPNVYGLHAFQEGLFEVQDEGSQLLGELVEAKPAERILELCAGAGGKTLQLGAAMGGRGELHAYDPNPEKLARLSQRAERAGLEVALHVHRSLPAQPLHVDRVLVDAPCSETGALRRGPDRRFQLRPTDVARFPSLQREILETALGHLRPGGRLVYATCSVLRAENEEVVLRFLRDHAELTLESPGHPWLPASLRDASGFFHCFPHVQGTDGFFAAVFRRAGS